MNRQNKNPHVMYLAIIFALTLGLYWNALSGDFIWDDRGLILDNTSYLNDWRNLYEAFYKPFFGATPYYRPFLTGSLIIDYQLWGTNPFGYHFTNMVLHSFNALLVYGVMYVLLREAAPALLTSMLFTAHPVQSEAVAWVSGRNDLMLAFFALLSIIFHLRWSCVQGWRRTLAYACYLLAYTSALLTKESGIVLPLLLILVDHFYPDSRRRSVRGYGGILLVTIAYYCIRIIVIGNPGIELREGPLPDTIYAVIATYGYYFIMLLFPVFQSALPDMSASGFDMPSIIASSLLLVTCLAAIALMASKRLKEISFAILWVFISLVPVCGIFSLSIPALEHRLYLGTVGFSMLLPCVVYRLAGLQAHGHPLHKMRTAAALMAVAILLCYSAKTVTRNDIWNNELSFWLRTVHDSPRSTAARNNLGIAYARAGNHQMAIREFKQGIALDDQQCGGGVGEGAVQRAKLYNNLGQCYYQLLLTELPAEYCTSPVDVQGRDAIKRLFALSQASYQMALSINPADNEVRNNLKDLFYLMKHCPAAEDEYRKASAARHGQL